jgi:dethiobiotin synthetase
MAKGYFISGTDTGVGKTIASAILLKKLKADYWKPIQTGFPEDSDTAFIKKLLAEEKIIYHPEAIKLKPPLSPFHAALQSNVSISAKDIKLPDNNNSLIIEGAGGLLVPIEADFLMIDLIKKLGFKVILVSKNYLGSVNHTLLSIEALKNRRIPIAGLIFNGEDINSTEAFILKQSGCHLIGRIKKEKAFNAAVIASYADSFRLKDAGHTLY